MRGGKGGKGGGRGGKGGGAPGGNGMAPTANNGNGMASLPFQDPAIMAVGSGPPPPVGQQLFGSAVPLPVPLPLILVLMGLFDLIIFAFRLVVLLLACGGVINYTFVKQRLVNVPY